MFTSIHIKSFRSCRDVRLSDLQSILVLIGRNGAGKTNLMKAIAWACEYGSGLPRVANPKNLYSLSNDGSVQLTFSIKGSTYCYAIERITQFDKDMNIIISVSEKVYLGGEIASRPILSRQGEEVFLYDEENNVTTIKIASTTPSLPAIHSLLPESNPFKTVAEDILIFLGSVKYYPLHNFEEISESALVPGEMYRKWKSNKQDNFNSVSNLQYTLIELSEDHPEVLEELNSLLGVDGLGVIDNISVEGHSIPGHSADEKKYAFFYVSFALNGGGPSFSINDLSFGTIRILFLVLSMLYDKASVALLEQPEDGIHMALIKKLVPMLRSYSFRSQFFISSHSSAVMNLTKPAEIRFVANEDGFTSVRPLTELEFEVARDFLEEEGSFAEFLQSIGA
jgi:predicted ATPase